MATTKAVNFRKIACVLETLSNLTDCAGPDEAGSVVLGFGQHEVVITTSHTPAVVRLSTVSGDLPVCQGNINMVGYTVTEAGFVLYADIKSNTCEVLWGVDF